MKENEASSLPALVEGNPEIEVYEYKGNLCMTTEFLGKCLGYQNPNEGMGKLFARNKAILEGHRFLVTADKNPQGGRPSFFYDEGGILKVIALAGTEASKAFGPRLIDRLETLKEQRHERQQDKYIALLEKHVETLDKRSRGNPLTIAERDEIRKLHEEGVPICEIAQRLKRNKGGISNFLKYSKTSGRLIKDD